jgi:hypothetical protein
VRIGTLRRSLDHPDAEVGRRRLRRSFAVLAVAAATVAVAAPIATAADPGRYVQIGGELVLPAQLSSWQAHAGQASSGPRLVQIGGALVAPENLSRYQAQASQPTKSSVRASTGDSGFDWGDAGIGIAAGLGTVLFVAASAYVRRMRLTEA